MTTFETRVPVVDEDLLRRAFTDGDVADRLPPPRLAARRWPWWAGTVRYPDGRGTG